MPFCLEPFQVQLLPSHERTYPPNRVVSGSVRSDFKILLSLQVEFIEDCARLIGEKAMCAVSALGGATPDGIAVRRTMATGRWIGFHYCTTGSTSVVVCFSVSLFVKFLTTPNAVFQTTYYPQLFRPLFILENIFCSVLRLKLDLLRVECGLRPFWRVQFFLGVVVSLLLIK